MMKRPTYTAIASHYDAAGNDTLLAEGTTCGLGLRRLRDTVKREARKAGLPFSLVTWSSNHHTPKSWTRHSERCLFGHAWRGALGCLALASMAALAPAVHADTFDVITGTTLRSYEGRTLYVQQAGSLGAARFWAASSTTSKVRPGFGSGATTPIGDWSVHVITAGSVLVLTADQCRIGAIEVGGGDEPHWTFACDDVEVAP